MKRRRIHIVAKLILVALWAQSCATYAPQFKEHHLQSAKNDLPTHSFYLVGGFGNDTLGPRPKLHSLLKTEIEKAGKNSSLLFLGDNISTYKDQWEIDSSLIDKQLKLTENFKGTVTFVPGNNEWKSKNAEKVQKVEEFLDEVDRQEDFVLPKNACPLEYRTINDDLDVILVDSKWFISNWSRVANINRKCTNIRTRRRFAEELEGYINDAQGKNLLIVMHHPIFSNGVYAGHESFKTHMTPLPVVGSILNTVGDLAAFSPDELLSRRYNYLRILVSALAQNADRAIVVSGHEESLQYLKAEELHQIISGSFTKATPTKRTKDKINALGGNLTYEGQFTYGEAGFAKLDYFEDGSSRVTFFTEERTESFDIIDPVDQEAYSREFTKKLPIELKTSVYGSQEGLQKSTVFEYLWGQRYRSYFGKEVSAPVAFLDTLYGGLSVTKKGGGHQSYSIRLEDGKKREFSMRSLRKNPLKFLKFSVQGVAYSEEEYEGTVPVKLISDFFTTAHPYMQMVINPLARAVSVNHADTKLYYIPKQERLGFLNKKFGNELYFIEQRPSDEQLNYKGYRRTLDGDGKITDFESTTDMLEKIKSDESYTVDQQSYVRARIFDMLIGDWDRHQDQWRWAEYETPDGTKEFNPIPRDRDNAFPKFDGNAVSLIQWFMPITRQFQSYGPTIKNLKWLNYNGGKLDQTLLSNYDARAWEREARYLQEHLSEDTIDRAFLALPEEVRDSVSESIKKNLKIRLKDLDRYAKAYGAYLNKRVAIHATEKDDAIYVTRLGNGKTKVEIRRLLSDRENVTFYERIFEAEETKEIWIYGLGDDDRFEVSGPGKAKIFIRLVGGYGKDVYTIDHRKRLKVYDWKQEEVTFKNKPPSRQLTDLYKTNTFHWRYFKPSRNILVPTIGFRTDDGPFLGAKNSYIRNGFNGNPFRQKHTLAAKYHFKFEATEIDYQGIFANIFPKWNFELNGYVSSDRYANNFFGLGNNSVNNEDQVGEDFYRARTEQWRLSAGIAYHTLKIRGLFESFELSNVSDRLFTPQNLGPELFERQNYVGAEATARYYNSDANDFPTRGIAFDLTLGYKANTALSENKFGYLTFKTEISQKLIPSGDLVIASTAQYKTNIDGDYFFYHAPSIGGSNGLRGFRDERFTGKSYFYQSSDLRWRVKRYTTALAPVTLGIYGGFDYGRVWHPDFPSNRWHTSQGVGLWFSIGNYLSFNAGVFNSVEDTMVQAGFGFGF